MSRYIYKYETGKFVVFGLDRMSPMGLFVEVWEDGDDKALFTADQLFGGQPVNKTYLDCTGGRQVHDAHGWIDFVECYGVPAGALLRDFNSGIERTWDQIKRLALKRADF